MNTGISIFLYLCGIVIFGLIYKIFDFIVSGFRSVSSSFSVNSDMVFYCNLIWAGALIVYLIAGIIYIIIDIKNWRYIYVR